MAIQFKRRLTGLDFTRLLIGFGILKPSGTPVPKEREKGDFGPGGTFFLLYAMVFSITVERIINHRDCYLSR